MITMRELIGHNLISEVPLGYQRNLEELQRRMNLIRTAYGKPMIVTSGFRSMQRHVDIYRTKALRERRPFSSLQIPMGSRHLSGQAVDIADPDGSLMTWCEQNVHLLEEAGLWLEKGTKGWAHFQANAPKSGNRFFRP